MGPKANCGVTLRVPSSAHLNIEPRRVQPVLRSVRAAPVQVDPAAAVASGSLFEGGPPLMLQFRLGLVRPNELRTGRRLLLFVGLAWLPLFVLAAAEGRLFTPAAGGGLITDSNALARFLVAGPLLIAAEVVCLRALGSIARRFLELRLVREPDYPRFERALGAVLRWRDSVGIEVLVAGAAYAISVAAVQAVPLSELPAWHRAPGGGESLSLAGWWYALLSLPLLLMLVLGWMWRLLLWSGFLLHVARLDLALLPVHPDRAAGLGFVGQSVRAFGIVGAAFGAIVAGGVAQDVLHGGADLAGFRYTAVVLAATVVALFTAPLCAFTPRLVQAWREGRRRYGELAMTLGRAFEREWFGAAPADRPDILSRGDFSAATDLFQVFDRVRDLRFIPVDLPSLGALAAATLLPFVPVVLLALPFERVLDTLLGLLR